MDTENLIRGCDGAFDASRRHWLSALAGLPLLTGLAQFASGAVEKEPAPADGIERKLIEMGLFLPPPIKVPPGVTLPFSMVKIVGKRALISGHGPQLEDGSLSPIKGKLGEEVSLEDGYEAAKLTALSILASLKRELGSLDRITNWCRVFGMVASGPGFDKQPGVINGFSDLILELFGPERGQHCRSAVGMAELPFGIPVEIEGEVEFE